MSATLPVDSGSEDLDLKVDTPASEIAPLIIWGEDGVPVLNEEAVDPQAQSVSPEPEPAKSKKAQKKLKGKQEKALPEFVEEEKPNMTMIVRTNVPLSQASTKTRMQDFYEFTSRLNKKHTISLPDMVTPGDTEDVPPLFSEDELTSTNRTGHPLRLVTSFETKIRLVNSALRFVVLDYSYEPIPPMETRLAIYRGEERMGAVKVTGPVKDGSVVAIILEGTPRVGDTVLRETWQ